MYKYKVINLLSHKEKLETDFVPEYSNMLFDLKCNGLGDIWGEVVETYGEYHKCNTKLYIILKMNNLNNNCFIKITEEQYKKMNKEI